MAEREILGIGRRPLLSGHRRQISYLFVGGLLFLIDFGLSVSTYHIFHIAPGYASAIGFCSSFVAGFMLNKKVVFRHTQSSKFTVHKQVTLYLLLAFVNLFITSLTVNYFVRHGIRIE